MHEDFLLSKNTSACHTHSAPAGYPGWPLRSLQTLVLNGRLIEGQRDSLVDKKPAGVGLALWVHILRPHMKAGIKAWCL